MVSLEQSELTEVNLDRETRKVDFGETPPLLVLLFWRDEHAFYELLHTQTISNAALCSY